MNKGISISKKSRQSGCQVLILNQPGNKSGCLAKKIKQMRMERRQSDGTELIDWPAHSRRKTVGVGERQKVHGIKYLSYYSVRQLS